jgi:hypothetical protein
MAKKESWLFMLRYGILELIVLGGLYVGFHWFLNLGPMQRIGQFFGPYGKWIGFGALGLWAAWALLREQSRRNEEED